ncbi:FtsX-like permease family protein [Mumia zhuanghuii]|uniref:FtsX-like permease family protein n=1 Tax=Mumia zhuanghuii TaxID=2585211 RepID=A0A5C4MPX9_9ACTN|nr:FtsX-like permease family protein [Mumia zhuanghuii]TNC47360.1 FtsX-like permease family protein [Mumia zhuanghuii]TNC47661.1 FtsX-like permease family protein [Mumia zhuanghuii]
MKTAVALGARLAFGTRGQRLRSLAVLGACALGTAFVLTVCGIAVDQLLDNTAFQRRAVVYFIAGANLIVALPVLALLTTVSRLSASVRDQRLANLRLLGMPAQQTRAVAATEVGVVSTVGTLLGGLVHALCVIAVPPAALAPWGAWVAVLLAVPAAGMIVAALPQRGSGSAALAQSRRSLPADPQWWRGLPLLVGLVLCWLARREISENPALHLPQAAVLATLFGGVATVGIGILLVVPVFTRLVAAVVLRHRRGPLATLLGRRLQDQPAAMTRVVTTLMVGLFAVMMATAVLSAFLSTPQYVAASDHVEREQLAEVSVTVAQAASTRARIASVAAVNEVSQFPIAALTWGDYDLGEGGTALIARCSQLTVDGRPLTPCTDTRANPVGEPWYGDGTAPSEADVQAWREDNTPTGSSARVRIDFGAASISPDAFRRAVGALEGQNVFVVSPDLPGVADLLPHSQVVLVAHGGPGDDLYDQLEAAGVRLDSYVDLENYRFVQGMQRLIWAVAVTVLSLGLLAFAVATIDRGIARQRELTALRLIGTPAPLLRWTQWLEALVPTALGSLLALGCGAYAGSTYLQVDRIAFPMRSAALLSATALTVSAVLALITVLGTSSRLDPEHIRTE